MSKADQPAVSGGGRSGIPVRLPEDEKLFAAELGDTVVARGVRHAIKAASVLGLDAVLRLAGPDYSEEEPDEGRGRGRPRIGKPMPIRLTPEEIKLADALGDVGHKTITAVGVRRALRACARLGVDATKRLLD